MGPGRNTPNLLVALGRWPKRKEAAQVRSGEEITMPAASPVLVTAVPKLPARAADSHKGDFGRILIVSGSRGMSGAAILCATAALRGGAGLVRVAVPADI